MNDVPVLTDQVKIGKLPEEGSQERALVIAFWRGEKLSALDALRRYGIYALAQRVSRLRNKYHWGIKDEWIELPKGEAKHAKRVKVYFL